MRWVVASITLAVLLLVDPSPRPPASDERPASRPTPVLGRSDDRPRMFAYYYLWWSESHWQEMLGPSYPVTDHPQPLPASLDAEGCQAVPAYPGSTLFDVAQFPRGQDNAGVIEQDVRDAARAGLAGFVANWAGSGSATQDPADSPYSRRLAELIRAVDQVRAEGTDFSLWISYKGSATTRTRSEINGDLEFLERTWASDPAFDGTYGRPVVLLTGSRKYSTADLRAVSEANRASFYLVGDETRSTWDGDRAALLDGDHYYWSSQDPYANPDSFEQLESLADAVRGSGPNPDGAPKTWFAPLTPGYNSTLIGGSTCVPRKDGETLGRLYEGNRASRPDAWVLISWNEIAEGTYVQPLTRWGSRYTDLIGQLLTG